MIEVRRAGNGWITKDRAGREEVFLDQAAMLRAVYLAVCDWRVGDRIEIVRNVEEPS